MPSSADAPKGPLSDAELLALISMYEKASLGSQVAAGATISSSVFPSNQSLQTLQVDRYNALNAYMARPLGNEIENRSQLVMPVVRDTVNWIMPQLMRMFAASKSICRFPAENEQDEDQAETETEVTNQVFMAQNDGIILLHDIFWDALLLRNAYAQVYTREWRSVKEESYTGLDQLELTQLLGDTADEELKVIGHREYLRDLIMPLPQMPQPPMLPPGQGLESVQPIPQQIAAQLVTKVPAFDVKLRRTKDNKRTLVQPIPPEEMRVSPSARNGVEDIPFSCHMTVKTRSALIQEGFDADLVNDLPAGRSGTDWLDIDALARNKVVDQLSIENPSDFAMQEVEYRAVNIQVDYDGDGIAELREVIVGGDKILRNEMLEETRFVSAEAMRMPHRHTGFSIYDMVMDLQIIQSNLLRAGLDNLTIATNLRIAVDWRNVNMDDLLTSRPHGPIRGNGPPSTWIEPLPMPTNIMSEILPMQEYLDGLRTQRTGIGKGTMGLDADELQNVTKGGQLAAMSAAALIVELIARMLAEGVKGIFQKIRNELVRHQDKPMWFKIRGKWTEVDPASWRRERQVVPNVGLGSGNREEMRANVMMLTQAMAGLAPFQMVGPKQAYNAFKKTVEALGFSDPESFAMDPSSQEFQQHLQQMQQAQQQAAQNSQMPAVQVAKIRAQTALATQQATNQREQGKLQAQMMQDKLQMMHEAAQNDADRLHEGMHGALQGDADRLHAAQQGKGDREMQILLKLIPAIAQILAAEKGNPDELGGDVARAEGQVE